MTKLFGNQNTQKLSQRQTLENKYHSSRHNILLVVVFTLVNLVLLVTNSNTYFLFSASIPYYLVDLGMYLCGKYPAEYYVGMEGMELLDNSFLVVTLVIAAVILLLYLFSWIFSKKPRVGWMIFALVFFVLDTLGMLWWWGISADLIIDIVFHGWVIISLITGITSYYKLIKLPEEEPLADPVEQTLPQIEEE